LVDGVVQDLPQAVHEAAGVRRADVHARALADGLQALEDLEVAGVVGGFRRGGGRGHAWDPTGPTARIPALRHRSHGVAPPANHGAKPSPSCTSDATKEP